MNKKTIILSVAMALILVLIGIVLIGVVGNAINKVDHPVATIKIEGYDEPIVAELYPEYALNTVKNFITLANNGFYNGLIIHRVEKNFVIQGGDPSGDGTGGPTLSAIDSKIEKGSDADKKYSIDGEFSKNGYKNKLKHERGVLSMARSSYSTELIKEGYNSAGSQFFICLEDAPSLNGVYGAFGKVTSGMETADKISEVKLAVTKDEEKGTETQTSKPEQDVVISSITIDTHGIDYGKPVVHEAFDYSSWYLKKYYGM